MKKTLLKLLLITVISTTAAYSQKKSQPVNKKGTIAQQITQFMSDWANLSNQHNTAALNKMLPADLVLTFQDGEVQTKDEYLAALKNNPADFTIRQFDQNVNLFGSAVAVIRARYEVSVGTAKTEFQNTTTFLKRRGIWQPVAFHSSPLIKK